MKTCFFLRMMILALLMTAPFAAQAEVYKWVDSAGNTHFSDTPTDNSQPVDLPPTQTYAPAQFTQESKTGSHTQLSAPSLPANMFGGEENNASDAQARHAYSSINLAKPAEEETIWSNEGAVTIVVDLKPNLYPGDKMQVLLDGNPVGEPQASPVMYAAGIDQGTHTIAVQVVAGDGKVIMTSPERTIYMKRAIPAVTHF